MSDDGMTKAQQLRLFALLEGRNSDAFPTIAGAPIPVNRANLTELAYEIVERVLRKNHDYGDAWQALGKVGAAARFVDKMFRIEYLASGQEALVVDEKFVDSVRDMVGYGLLILLYEMYKGERDADF